MSDIRQWLAGLGLERFREAFEREELTPANVPDLTDEDLKGLGLPLGPRKTILKVIEAQRSGHAIAQPRAPDSYTPAHLADRILTSRAALEGERKQVTVLFADLKGSMELLADRDPEEARKILDPVLEHMMDAVHHYEGTVNQVMGDGIMALFGAPLAVEDHAVRACYAALRMQERVSRYGDEMQRQHGTPIQVRVGLNSGEVVVRAIGSDLHMDYSAIGQTTHLAARMEQMAKPGTVLATAGTVKLAEGAIAVRPLGPATVRGLAAPIELFELTGALTGHSRLQARAARGLTRFVGRQRELEALAQALQSARQGKGQALAIVGEPGVGKSRLFWEFTHSHRTQGCLVVEAGSVSYGKATPYLPIIELLKHYFEIGERDEARSVREKVTGKLLTLDRRLEALLAPILALLDQAVEDAQWQRLDPPQRRRQTLDALKHLCLREAQNQPLILVFEDLHWIDSETQEFLDGLLHKIPAAHLLLLCNYRPEYQHPWGGKSYYTQLRLDALTADSAEDLLASLLGDDPEVEALKAMLIEHTEGNPLFLEESVRALVETGQLAGVRGAYRPAQPLGIIEVPATVQALLAARIDRLEAQDKRLLQTAAVIGKDVPFALLQAVADLPEVELGRGLAHLQAAEFLYEASLFPDVEYTFKHALTHDVTYGSLLQERKRELHARIVGAIEQSYPERLSEHVERLAHHAQRGEVWDKAVSYLRQAGQRAFARSANAEALGWWEQALAALEHLPEGEEKVRQAIDIRLEMRGALFTLGELGTAGERIAQARVLAEQAGDRYRTARALAYLVHVYFFTAEFDEAIAAGERALKLATEDEHFDVQVIARLFLPVVFQFRGSWKQAEAMHRESIEMLTGAREDERFGLPAFPSVYARGLCAWLLGGSGRFAEALALLHEGAEIVRRLGHPYSDAHNRYLFCAVLTAKGDFREAVAAGEAALEICKASESWLLYPIAATYLGSVYAEMGRAQEGIKLISESSAQFERMGIRIGQILTFPLLATAYFQAGDLDASLVKTQHFLNAQRERDYRFRRPMMLELLGRIHSHPDRWDPATSQERYCEALHAAENLGDRVTTAHCHLGLGRLKGKLGLQAEARCSLQLACEMYREMEMTFYLGEAQQALAGLA